MREHAAAQAKALRLEIAQDEVGQFEERIAELGGVLASRDLDMFDWEAGLQLDKSFVRQEFTAPAFDPKAEKRALNSTSGVSKWRGIGVASLVTAIGFALLEGGAEVLIVFSMMGLLASFVGLPVAHFRRHRLMGQSKTRFDQNVELLRQEHVVEQELLSARAELAPRLRADLENGTAEAMADLLEEELANETVPVPLVFDVEYDGNDKVAIEVVLPEPDEIPAERLSVTKRGDVSRKAMPQRDQRELYGRLACGLSLRLAYEAFRVLKPLREVEVRGTAEVTDPATGRPKAVTCLHFSVNRDRFEALNLDGLSPEAAVEGLGGMFGCSARLQLKEVKIPI